MDYLQKKKLRKKLLALGLASIMIGTTGCNNAKSEIPDIRPIENDDDNFGDFYQFSIKKDKVTKEYKSENIYITFNKETNETDEIVYHLRKKDLVTRIFDLETENLLYYSNGISPLQSEYLEYLLNNNILIHLPSIDNYIDEDVKECYSLDEIKMLETRLVDKLSKNKTKKK